MNKKTKSAFLRILLVILWVALFGALLKRDFFVQKLDIREAEVIKRGKEESFMGIYFQNERIGYVKNRLLKNSADDVEMIQEAFMRLNILNKSHPVRLNIKADLTEKLLLKQFDFSLSSPFYKMEAKGNVDGNTVNFTLFTGKERIKDKIQLKNPPFLSTNQRSYLLKQGLKEGDKVKIPYFDPISLSGKDTVLEYKGLKKILIQGRVYKLHHFVETFSGIRINSWLDSEGKVIKEESPAGFVFISEPEFKATNIVLKGKEILSSVSAPLIGVMPDLAGMKQIHYRLTLPEEGEFDLDRDRQTLAGDVVTVALETVPPPGAPACTGPAEALESTPYIQALNATIDKKTKELVKDDQTPMEKVRILSKWVYDNLEKRPVLGIPDAVTTLSTLMGDCNEHAALFAALARNSGIPTRVAAGVTFHEGAFYYHAWNEVCIDSRWITLDTTKNQFPADISHIKFIEGEAQDMIRIGALLGKLKVEVIKGNAN